MAPRRLALQSHTMDIVIRLVAKVIVPLFFLGMAGSLIVIGVSLVEDLKELLEDED